MWPALFVIPGLGNLALQDKVVWSSVQAASSAIVVYACRKELGSEQSPSEMRISAIRILLKNVVLFLAVLSLTLPAFKPGQEYAGTVALLFVSGLVNAAVLSPGLALLAILSQYVMKPVARWASQ